MNSISRLISGENRWLPERWTHLSVSKFEGTFGYLAPEFLMHGIVDEKTDVFAFGILLLELTTGRRALDYSQQSLIIWAKPLLKKNRIRELVDPLLADNYNLLHMNLMVLAASLCVQQSSIRRPRISQGMHSCIISVVSRFDKARMKSVINGYYLWMMVGYGIGLLFTYLGLYLMNGHGQPALLYLVPCTLEPVWEDLKACVVLGLMRGELKDLWNYDNESTKVTDSLLEDA